MLIQMPFLGILSLQLGIGEKELQVAVVTTEPMPNIDTLLQTEPSTNTVTSFQLEQEKDSYYLHTIIQFLEAGMVSVDPNQAGKIAIYGGVTTGTGKRHNPP